MNEVEAVARAIEDQLTTEDGWMVGTPALSSMCRDFALVAIAALDAVRGDSELEAFKREVSDAVEEVLAAKASQLKLLRFILPKPVDPLVEAIHEAWPGAAERFGNTVVGETAERLRKALASRGLKLVEAGDAD